ncbi:MAG: methyltransferase domain-containing protein [Acidobacteria bacterium]|nr:methyltransferase domain-containing protein [Acidobacteriota bacterium]
MAWYKEWFGEDYLELYAHHDAGEARDHVDFVERLFAQARPHAVLDLACGAGRHTRELRKRGYRVLGTDLSLTLLAQGADIPRVAGDMKDLPFADRAFDWVLNFFTSFGYFESERDNFRVLEEIVRVLRPGGRCLIDLFNREHVLATLEPRERQERNGQVIEIRRWYDAATRRVNKRICLQREGSPKRTYLESVRAYTQEEVVNGLNWAGLEIVATYGGFGGEPSGDDNERLIFIGRRS